jgi:hypothetical protein
MIYMWFTGINYYKLAVEKDRDSIFTTIWKPGPPGYQNEKTMLILLIIHTEVVYFVANK